MSENQATGPRKVKKTNEEKSSLELILSKTKFHIYSYLEIYRQLTSADFERLLKKSKSTIHTHLQDLIEIGIVAPPEMRDIKGNMIYRLAENYQAKITSFDSAIDYDRPNLPEEDLLKILQIEAAFAKINQANCQILIDFAAKVFQEAKRGLSLETRTLLEKMMQHKRDGEGKLLKDAHGENLSQFELLSSFSYVSHNAYMIFREEWANFCASLQAKTQPKTDDIPEARVEEDKSMLITTTGFPMKRMLEFINKSE